MRFSQLKKFIFNLTSNRKFIEENLEDDDEVFISWSAKNKKGEVIVFAGHKLQFIHSFGKKKEVLKYLDGLDKEFEEFEAKELANTNEVDKSELTETAEEKE